MLLTDFFESTYRTERLLGKSENTNRLYRISIRNFAKTLGKQPNLDDLTVAKVCRHMQRMLDDGKAAATANKDRAQLVTIWRYAFQKTLVAEFPNVPQLTEPERTPVAWLPEEFSRLIDTIDQLDGMLVHVPRSLWWRTILLVCLDTGERIGAIRIAKWEWIYGEWLNVPAEARKGKRRDRAYRLNSETIGHLQAIRLASPSRPFPWPYCEDYLWTKYNEILKAAGLPHGRRDKFHKIRRTTASVSNAAGMDAQEVLDHAYRRTTQRYLDPRFTRDKQACDVIGAFLNSANTNDVATATK